MNRRCWACQLSFCADGSGPLFCTINLGLRDLQMNPMEYCGLDVFQLTVCDGGCVSKPSSQKMPTFLITCALEDTGRGEVSDWKIAQWSVTNILSTTGASGACPCSDGWMPFPLALWKPWLLWCHCSGEASCLEMFKDMGTLSERKHMPRDVHA